jgi:hypothetical protein
VRSFVRLSICWIKLSHCRSNTKPRSQKAFSEAGKALGRQLRRPKEKAPNRSGAVDWIPGACAPGSLRISGTGIGADPKPVTRQVEPSALHPQSRRIAIKFWRDIFVVEGSCRGRSQDRSDRSRLLLRFSYQACASACLQARMIVSPHRIFPHRKEATGTTDWIGQLSASAGMCVPSARWANKQLGRLLWRGSHGHSRCQLRPSQHPRLRRPLPKQTRRHRLALTLRDSRLPPTWRGPMPRPRLLWSQQANL